MEVDEGEVDFGKGIRRRCVVDGDAVRAGCGFSGGGGGVQHALMAMV